MYTFLMDDPLSGVSRNKRKSFLYAMGPLTLSEPTLRNGQTHANNSLAVADELFEFVWPFCGVGAEKLKYAILNQLTK